MKSSLVHAVAAVVICGFTNLAPADIVAGGGSYYGSAGGTVSNRNDTNVDYTSLEAHWDNGGLVIDHHAYVRAEYRAGPVYYESGSGATSGGGSFFAGYIHAGSGVDSLYPDSNIGLRTGNASIALTFIVTNTFDYPVAVSGGFTAGAYSSNQDANNVGGIAGTSLGTGSIGGGAHAFAVQSNPADNGESEHGQETSASGSGVLWPGQSASVTASAVSNASGSGIARGGYGAYVSWSASAGGAVAIPTVPAGSGGNWSGISFVSSGVGGGGSIATPNATSARAYFAPQSGPTTVSLDSGVTLGHLTFGGTGAYTLAGPSSLTLADSASTSMVVLAGNHTISATTAVSDDLYVQTEGTSSLTVTSPITFASGTRIVKEASGSANFANLRVDAIDIQQGKVGIISGGGTGGISKTGSLAISSGATLDVNDSSILVDYSGATPFADIRSKIISGYNAGAWAGTGITSSTAAVTANRGLGYAEASTLGLTSFGGQIVDSTTVIVDYCLYGDVNLSGTVDFADLTKVAQNYNTTGKIWSDGDVTYDGNVDFADNVKVAQNYNLTGRSSNLSFLDELDPVFAADFRLALSLVPEPSSLGALAGLSTLAMRRRR